MLYLEKLIKDVDNTHPGLGILVAFSLIATQAKKTLLVIAPAGMGKSASSNFISKQYQRSILLDRVSASGMRHLEDKLSDFNGIVVIDDLAKARTEYMRVATCCSLIELTYSHYLMSKTAHENYEITGFQGSVIINLQPVLFSQLLSSAEWEASIADKSIRFYHLKRPLKPNTAQIQAQAPLPLDVDKIANRNDLLSKTKPLKEIGFALWSEARAKQHIADLLKATASLNGHQEVTEEDCDLLYRLLKPCLVERHILFRAAPEQTIRFNRNLLYLLIEFATHKNITLEQIASDYKISEATARLWLDNLSKWWIISGKNPITYSPSKELETILKEIGEL